MKEEKYQATDDDIPWSADGKTEEFSRPVVNEELVREVAVQVHYPVVPEEQLTKRQRASLKADREGGIFKEDRRVYIKTGKKIQMYWWLCNLESCYQIMSPGECQFCVVQLEKFKRYTVQKAKWITDKQYQWVKSIAAKYLIAKYLTNGRANSEIKRENSSDGCAKVSR